MSHAPLVPQLSLKLDGGRMAEETPTPPSTNEPGPARQSPILRYQRATPFPTLPDENPFRVAGKLALVLAIVPWVVVLGTLLSGIGQNCAVYSFLVFLPWILSVALSASTTSTVGGAVALLLNVLLLISVIVGWKVWH
jgi:hypothetical protein